MYGAFQRGSIWMLTELHDGTTWIKEVISLRKIACFRQKYTIRSSGHYKFQKSEKTSFFTF